MSIKLFIRNLEQKNRIGGGESDLTLLLVNIYILCDSPHFINSSLVGGYSFIYFVYYIYIYIIYIYILVIILRACQSSSLYMPGMVSSLYGLSLQRAQFALFQVFDYKKLYSTFKKSDPIL